MNEQASIHKSRMIMTTVIAPISVVIPTYNRRDFLRRAIDSVLAQNYAGEVELIVVDDGSTDGSDALLASYGDALRCLRQDNRGPAAARNTGILAARHDLIAFLDSDDFFLPTKLTVQSAMMGAAPEYLYSHTQERWLRDGVHLNQKKIHRRTHGDIFTQCLRSCCVGMSTVMIRRRLFVEIGLFDEAFPCCEDYDLWLRASCRFPILLIDSPLTTKHGGHADQVSMQYRVGMDRLCIDALIHLLSSNALTFPQTRQAACECARKCRIYGNGCAKYGRQAEANFYHDLAERCQAQAVGD